MNTNAPKPESDAADTHAHGADVSAQRIARVYADALLGAAERAGESETVLSELESVVRDLFHADPTFESFLASGTIGRDRKGPILDRIFGGRASVILTNFLQVLNNHQRLDLLRTIVAAYRTLLDERARRIRVEVRSVVPLPDDQRERLRNDLRQTFRLEPVLEEHIDPDLLGGMIVKVGDWLVDSSVRTRLNNLRNQLIARSSHEIQSGRDRFSAAL
jgi:F-type H+-transporting ATPase subunit delta